LYFLKFYNIVTDIFLPKKVLNGPTFTRKFEEENNVLYTLRCIVVEKYFFFILLANLASFRLL
jgi:hypothetical protein